MKVDSVEFTASPKISTTAGAKGARLPQNSKYQCNWKPSDIIPMSALIGFALMCVYLMKKGNMDIGMRAFNRFA